jgi:hypothetical protein
MCVRLARKIHPRNPEITAFIMQCVMDEMIYGKSIVRVGPKDVTEEV